MPKLRSATTTQGRNMAGARALWRATGMKDSDFGKPIIAIANSFTQFVPGHVHLKDLGQLVARSVEEAGGVAKEFNTIAVDDGIAMGHSGMLYSLPSREIIADAVEYMVNAHCADAIVCISNCDKITPGMLMASMRLNVPVIFVSGGPMDKVSDADTDEIERSACPTCGSCSGMFTANSMNCLTEALGLSLPGNGSMLATHADREGLFKQAGKQIVELCKRYYGDDDESVLPRNIANFKAFENAMSLDIAMGGSTNTILHLLAAAMEGEVPFTMADIDRLSRKVPHLCKVAPSTPKYHMEDVHRAGGVLGILNELNKAGLLNTDVNHVLGKPLTDVISEWDITNPENKDAITFYRAGPAGIRTTKAFSQDCRWDEADDDRENGCIRSIEHAFSNGTARIYESQDDAVAGILGDEVKAGDVVFIRYEGPRGGPGMQEMLYPTSYLKSKGLGKHCALVTDGRFSGGTSGLSIGHCSPEAASGGGIGLVEDGDKIEIDIPNRSINIAISDEELAERRVKMEASDKPWKPKNRVREVSTSLKTFAALATSADKGAVRDVSKLENL